jgi:hypothetical protein
MRHFLLPAGIAYFIVCTLAAIPNAAAAKV